MDKNKEIQIREDKTYLITFEDFMNSQSVMIDNKEALFLCSQIFNEAKKQIQESPEFKTSLVLIFSLIGEYYDAVEDKRKLRKLEKIRLTERIEFLKLKKEMLIDAITGFKIELAALNELPKQTKETILGKAKITASILDVLNKLESVQSSLEKATYNKNLKYFEYEGNGKASIREYSNLSKKMLEITNLLRKHGFNLQKINLTSIKNESRNGPDFNDLFKFTKK